MTWIWGSISPLDLVNEDRRLSEKKKSQQPYIGLVFFVIKHDHFSTSTCFVFFFSFQKDMGQQPLK